MKLKRSSHNLTPEEDLQLAKIAAVLSWDYGEEVHRTFRRWIAMFFKCWGL